VLGLDGFLGRTGERRGKSRIVHQESKSFDEFVGRLTDKTIHTVASREATSAKRSRDQRHAAGHRLEHFDANAATGEVGRSDDGDVPIEGLE
jgi:hypothetical protein